MTVIYVRNLDNILFNSRPHVQLFFQLNLAIFDVTLTAQTPSKFPGWSLFERLSKLLDIFTQALVAIFALLTDSTKYWASLLGQTCLFTDYDNDIIQKINY